jgi:hypothetical protein
VVYAYVGECVCVCVCNKIISILLCSKTVSCKEVARNPRFKRHRVEVRRGRSIIAVFAKALGNYRLRLYRIIAIVCTNGLFDSSNVLYLNKLHRHIECWYQNILYILFNLLNTYIPLTLYLWRGSRDISDISPRRPGFTKII